MATSFEQATWRRATRSTAEGKSASVNCACPRKTAAQPRLSPRDPLGGGVPGGGVFSIREKKCRHNGVIREPRAICASASAMSPGAHGGHTTDGSDRCSIVDGRLRVGMAALRRDESGVCAAACRCSAAMPHSSRTSMFARPATVPSELRRFGCSTTSVKRRRHSGALESASSTLRHRERGSAVAPQTVSLERELVKTSNCTITASSHAGDEPRSPRRASMTPLRASRHTSSSASGLRLLTGASTTVSPGASSATWPTRKLPHWSSRSDRIAF
jgi:hypothetical protein